MSPVHLAAELGDEQIFRLLIYQGGNARKETPCRRTPLHLAAHNGHMAVVQLIIENGCKVSARDKSGMTALHLACQNGHTLVAAELLDAGAEKHALDASGETPLLAATRGGHLETVCLLLYWKVYPSFASTDGTTAVHVAAENGSPELLNALLAAKADPHALNCRYETPLCLAARGGHLLAVERLMVSITWIRGLDIDDADAQGRTPLHGASANGHTGVLKALLEGGAAWNAKDVEGRTPWDVAGENVGGEASLGCNMVRQALSMAAAQQQEVDKMLAKKSRSMHCSSRSRSGASGGISAGTTEGPALSRCMPGAFLCPITKGIMRDPVVAADGHTYERAAIAEWLEAGRASPVAGEPFNHADLHANSLLRAAIETWHEKTANSKEHG
ncbi:unnamed protein product [Ostreobium quekettii]|uniref:U-box domain-containing protein n=1 Tax=Ostreobium quekettii TaxID=121088 RepID=A0A8S1J0D7_9CHLO|nr:unnamed protein product [Ostreobium quekettii]